MVLDVGSWHMRSHKWNHECGCGSVLLTRATIGAVKLLLVYDVTYDHGCHLGECSALGKLAGTTICGSEPVFATAG